jgi:hypothetical protein
LEPLGPICLTAWTSRCTESTNRARRLRCVQWPCVQVLTASSSHHGRLSGSEVLFGEPLPPTRGRRDRHPQALQQVPATRRHARQAQADVDWLRCLNEVEITPQLSDSLAADFDRGLIRRSMDLKRLAKPSYRRASCTSALPTRRKRTRRSFSGSLGGLKPSSVLSWKVAELFWAFGRSHKVFITYPL